MKFDIFSILLVIQSRINDNCFVTFLAEQEIYCFQHSKPKHVEAQEGKYGLWHLTLALKKNTKWLGIFVSQELYVE